MMMMMINNHWWKAKHGYKHCIYEQCSCIYVGGGNGGGGGAS
mgnify:CR=1 FL=1